MKFRFSNIVKMVLGESLTRKAYHFTTFNNYHQMLNTDTILFSKAFGTDRLINFKHGKGMYYYLSTTRVRDGRVGFSKSRDVRMELNTDYFNDRFRANAVNFFSVPGEYDRLRDGNDCIGPNEKKTENEDRIYSPVSAITGITQFVERVDIYLPLDDLNTLKTRHYDWYTKLNDIYSTDMATKTFVYNDEWEFNIQGKNITEDILKIL